ncbi:hypothetical protein F4X86_00510 [Candidatus Saccharibacteria bacterium]|nr:hypothetical protein [Candidatus Saccharibacteria bacterium]
MKFSKPLIIIIVLIVIAAIVGLVLYLSGGGDAEDATAPDTSEQQTPEENSEEAGAEENGDEQQDGEATDQTQEEEQGTDATDPDTATPSLTMRAEELLGNLVDSNDRLEPLVAACDQEAINQENLTFVTHLQAAFAFVDENTDNPVALAELTDFPDEVNAQSDRNGSLNEQTADCSF